MPEVGLMIWDEGADGPIMNEVVYSIVPRVGDLIDLPDEDGKASAWRVFEVVVHHADGDLAADVHVERVSEPMMTCAMFIAEQRRTRRPRDNYPLGEPLPIVL